MKTTIRANKGGESHNGHSGWHIIACYELDERTGDIKFIQIIVADLIGHSRPGADWKYRESVVNKTTGSQRTETYVTTAAGTEKLRRGTVYLDTSVMNISRRSKPCATVIKRTKKANRTSLSKRQVLLER